MRLEPVHARHIELQLKLIPMDLPIIFDIIDIPYGRMAKSDQLHDVIISADRNINWAIQGL